MHWERRKIAKMGQLDRSSRERERERERDQQCIMYREFFHQVNRKQGGIGIVPEGDLAKFSGTQNTQLKIHSGSWNLALRGRETHRERERFFPSQDLLTLCGGDNQEAGTAAIFSLAMASFSFIRASMS